jgi:hypothetical protein
VGLNAPQALVWKVWSELDHLHQWFGPIGFTTTMKADGRKTRFSLHMTFRNAETYQTGVERYGILPGGTQAVDRIAEYVEGIG